MHMLARERLPSVPKLAFGCFGGVAVGGLELAQDVVTAPARMSAQPNLPTSVRATLQFGPIYLATGGGHWLEQGQRCRCKVGWLPTRRRPTGDLRQIIKVTSAAIFYLRRPLAFGGRSSEHVSDTDRAPQEDTRGHSYSLKLGARCPHLSGFGRWCESKRRTLGVKQVEGGNLIEQ